MNTKKLIEAAFAARERAYSPYSGFSVGAALLTKSGRIYTGCNIESVSFTPTCCAERVAFFKAVSEGERDFEAIAVVGGKTNDSAFGICPPCGVCRQVMAEFCGEDFKIILVDSMDNESIYTLNELLPMSFKNEI
ncbi:MAG: cytidine deaminase [Clostridia bacterium]|nr:cytidine deaminase [Clostridia bacterium]